MAEATQNARTLPEGLLEHLVGAQETTPDDLRRLRVARGRRHARYRTFDNTDVVRQVATELLRVSAGL